MMQDLLLSEGKQYGRWCLETAPGFKWISCCTKAVNPSPGLSSIIKTCRCLYKHRYILSASSLDSIGHTSKFDLNFFIEVVFDKPPFRSSDVLILEGRWMLLHDNLDSEIISIVLSHNFKLASLVFWYSVFTYHCLHKTVHFQDSLT